MNFSGDKEDIEATTNRLLSRCRTVDVNVSTPRNQEQERSLRTVHDHIETVLNKMKDDMLSSKQVPKQIKYLF